VHANGLLRLTDDLKALAKEPRGTHLGQLAASWFDGFLPPQFLPRYDSVGRLRSRFTHGDLVAHTVLEELALYIIFEQADVEFLLFTSGMVLTPDFSYHFDHWDKRQFYVDDHVESGAE
jgi:hypothetical protein